MDSSLPAVCGRVCPQETQCEGSCVRGIKGEPVAIGKLERYVADHALQHNYDGSEQKNDIQQHNGNNIKVAVIGSGPSGLSCAHDLAKAGCDVTVFEALHTLGGVLVYGIPEFRLPKSIVKNEVDKLKQLNVHFETNVIAGRTVTIDHLLDNEDFKAVYIASGAGAPKFMNIPGENLNGVMSANEFLTRVNLMHAYDTNYDTPVFAGKHVVVVGGGNVAMDAARCAIRFGSEVTLVYRRSEKELPARAEEIEHAKEEGLKLQLLTNPVQINGDDKGLVVGMTCVEMELGEPDGSGRRRPVVKQNSEFNISCDMVIMALGTTPNMLIASTTPNLDIESRCGIKTDEQGRTSRKGVFAGGDAVTGAATVILAMGAGRTAAKAILKYLQNEKYLPSD